MTFPFRLGLKLHSTNINLINESNNLWKEGLFHYVELYIIPGTFYNTIDIWQRFDVPYIIHAPHSQHGMNLSLSSQRKKNRSFFMEVQQFSDILRSEIIIAHGGHSGTIEEMMFQIKSFKDNRICLENKPMLGLNSEKCVGWSPDEFHKAIDSGSLTGGVVLDFVHASCAAFSLGQKPMELVKEFLVLKPKVFHLSDGDPTSERDKHLNIGKGGFNIVDFLSVIPENGLLTLETPRNDQNGLEDFVMDVTSLYNVLG